MISMSKFQRMIWLGSEASLRPEVYFMFLWRQKTFRSAPPRFPDFGINTLARYSYSSTRPMVAGSRYRSKWLPCASIDDAVVYAKRFSSRRPILAEDELSPIEWTYAANGRESRVIEGITRRIP